MVVAGVGSVVVLVVLVMVVGVGIVVVVVLLVLVDGVVLLWAL